MSQAVSRFPVPSTDQLPGDMQAAISEVEASTGFVPNVYRMLSHRPDESRAFFGYLSLLMDAEGGLPKVDRELVAVVTSAVNQCMYCVVSHSALARLHSGDAVLADQVAIDWRKADVSGRQRAMLEFVETFARAPAEVVEHDYDRLRDNGFAEDEIWEIGAITAFFSMSNRLAHLGATPPNPEFHLMGRVPRSVYDDLTGN